MVRTINTIERMFIDFLRVGICGGEISQETADNITEENLVQIYNLAQKHDLAHIVGDVLFKKKIMPDCDIAKIYEYNLLMSVLRYQNLNFELQRICDLFEKNEIPHIPLKGAVMREYYPEPWLRTSCDIDILVKTEDIEQAERLFVDCLNYTKKKRGPHDISFYSEAEVHIELHFDLIENHSGKTEKSRRWNAFELENVWDVSVPAEDKKYQYEMPDEFFYLYHIAHMAKHVEEGGCGIRPFIDSWILDNCLQYNPDKRLKMIEKSELSAFISAVKGVCEVWFEGKEHNKNSKMLEEYVIGSGVYGNLENRVKFYTRAKGGKMKYFIHRMFPSYNIMKYQFSILERYRWLLPVCYIIRIVKFAGSKKVNRALSELEISGNACAEEGETLFDSLGLQ